MAGRIRTLKPEILERERTATLSSDAWRLYVSLIVLADDFGNAAAIHPRLHAAVFWGCPHPVAVKDLIEELVAAGLISKYSVKGEPFLSILGWSEHQQISHRGKPRVPGPDVSDKTTGYKKSSGDPPETLRKNSTPSGDPPSGYTIDDRRETTITAQAPALAAPGDEVYQLYPRKIGKQAGMKKLAKLWSIESNRPRLLAAVKHFSIGMRTREKDKIPYFSTWINEQWQDWEHSNPDNKPPTSISSLFDRGNQ